MIELFLFILTFVSCLIVMWKVIEPFYSEGRENVEKGTNPNPRD